MNKTGIELIAQGDKLRNQVKLLMILGTILIYIFMVGAGILLLHFKIDFALFPSGVICGAIHWNIIAWWDSIKIIQNKNNP